MEQRRFYLKTKDNAGRYATRLKHFHRNTTAAIKHSITRPEHADTPRVMTPHSSPAKLEQEPAINAQMAFFDDVLKLMTSYVSHGTLTMKSFAELLAPLFKSRMPVLGVSVIVFHDQTHHRIAGYCSDSAYIPPDEFRISSNLMERLSHERERLDFENACIVEAEGTGILSEIFHEIYGPDMASIFIPLGFFPHFAEFVCIAICSKGHPYTQQHVDYCNAIRRLLVFIMAVILKQEPLKFENGHLVRQTPETPASEPPKTKKQTLDEHIIECILSSLHDSRGRVAGKNGAAAMLGLNSSTLWSKIRKYRIEMPRIPEKTLPKGMKKS